MTATAGPATPGQTAQGYRGKEQSFMKQTKTTLSQIFFNIYLR